MDKQAISMVGTFQPTRLTRLGLAHRITLINTDDEEDAFLLLETCLR
ncbi:MAG: hypothetical protein K9J81_08580 [Desulfohalobiaceae bacterium]|nr:hypothetical protein [Desulfohalobiaceae bacterium]